LALERANSEERTKALAHGAAQLELAFEELNRHNAEVRERLAVTPMNLDAAALQAEWRALDTERVLLAKATKALETAAEKLADAHAAMDSATADS